MVSSEDVEHLQGLPSAQGHGLNGVLRHHHGDAGGLLQGHVQVPKEGPAPGEEDAPLVDVRGKLRGSALQDVPHPLEDLAQGLLEGLHDVLGGDLGGAGKAGEEVPAPDLGHLLLLPGEELGPAQPDLELLGGALPDEEVVLLADVEDDGLVHLVPGDAETLRAHDPAQGDDGDVRGAAPDVHHHAPRGLGHVDPRPDGGRQGFLNEVDLVGQGGDGLDHGPPLHVRHPGGNPTMIRTRPLKRRLMGERTFCRKRRSIFSVRA